VPGEGSDVRGCQRRRWDPLRPSDLAVVGTANEEPGCASAGSLSAWHLDRRLPGGIGGAVGQGCAEPVAGGDLQKRDLSARRYLLLIGVGSQRRSASQAIDLPSDGGVNLERLFTVCPFL